MSKEWEFVDTVYSEAEAKRFKDNMEKSGYEVKVEYHETPSNISAWWILVRKKKGGN